jgi:hypothetical protein
MGHSLGDGIIVLALAGVLVAYWYFKHVERQRRLDVVHQERLIAMDKGIPLPELPIDPPRDPRPQDPRVMLIHGVVWSALGIGGMLGTYLVVPEWNGHALWPLTLPAVFLGIGLMLYYVLASKHSH